MITNTGLNEMKDIMAYLDKVPYCVTRRTLYNAAELYEGYKTDQHPKARLQRGGVAGAQPS